MQLAYIEMQKGANFTFVSITSDWFILFQGTLARNV